MPSLSCRNLHDSLQGFRAPPEEPDGSVGFRTQLANSGGHHPQIQKAKPMKNIVGVSIISAALGILPLTKFHSVHAKAPTETINIQVSLTFTEPVSDNHCPLQEVGGGPGQGFCGSGEVRPLGHASETIIFGGACGGACDLRTIDLAEGSILIAEVFTFDSGHGTGEEHQGNPSPFSGTLSDIIVGGTGLFDGATGSLNGTVRVAGKANQVKLSGSIVLASTP
jgi:hypothetical protein